MSSSFYRTQEWRRLRAECIERHPICATAGCGQPSRVADHVIPRSQGGADDIDNLVGRCITCHNARRGTAEPVLRGCGPDGTPRDRGHWWNIKSLKAELRTAPVGQKPVSSRLGYSGIRGRR